MKSEPHDRIVSDPDIMLGKPTIRGTRITVELVLRKLGEGLTEAELIEAYPHLAPEDIRAAQRFAADYLADECVDERIVHRLRAAGHDVVSAKAQLRGVGADSNRPGLPEVLRQGAAQRLDTMRSRAYLSPHAHHNPTR